MKHNNDYDISQCEAEIECMRKLDDATKEWDEVQEVIPSFAKETKSNTLNNTLSHNVKDTPLISVNYVIQDFRNQDLSRQNSDAQVIILQN